jgi:hypothetical protein
MRKTKETVLEIVNRKDISGSLPELDALPPQKILGPLFSGLLSIDEPTRWHCVTAMGHTVARIAGRDLERGRIVMRRLMWSLNDESGGIGWGAPECMAEIMAVHKGLAEEFHPILFSYLVERDKGADNYLEYMPLRRGAFWGLARLTLSRPEMTAKAMDKAGKALNDENDPFILACLCRYFHIQDHAPEGLESVIKPVRDREITMYWDQKLSRTSVRDFCPFF